MSGGVGGVGRSGPVEWPDPDPVSAPPPAPDRDGTLAALPFGPRGGGTRTELGPGRGKLPEPSGIAFHPERGSLFIVGDRGHVVELARDGTVLKKERVHHLDLEGVAIGPKGRIYALVEEKPPRLLELDPDSLEVRRSFKIDPDLDGKRVICRHPNEGLEGLCYVPEEGAFYAVNQDRPPRIVRLDVPLGKKDGGKARIEAAIDIKDIVDRQASDIAYDPASGHFLITESGGGRWDEGDRGAGGFVHEVTRDGRLVRSIPLRADRPEGLALDDRGAAYLAQDGGRILRISPR